MKFETSVDSIQALLLLNKQAIRKHLKDHFTPLRNNESATTNELTDMIAKSIMQIFLYGKE